jgi:VanZ family protein
VSQSNDYTEEMRRLRLWAPVIVYMALIFHFSSESQPLPEVTNLIWDKALHFTEYAGLGLLLCRALRGEGMGWLGAAIWALLLASAYGASDEWHQAFVPLRDSDVRDWMADTLGGTLGSGLYALVVGCFSIRGRSRAGR